jgi:ABC-2 type transport system permease protein
MKLLSLTLLKLEFKRNLKGLLVWSISLGLSLFLVIMVYPMVQDMMDALSDMLEYLESINSGFVGLLEVFGGIPDNGIEYFATEGALFLQLLGGIYAALLGFSIINKDEKEKTIEVIHVLPISRFTLLFSKIIHVAIALLIFTAIQIGAVHLGFVFVSPRENIAELWRFGLFDYVMFLMIAYFSMGLALTLKPNQSSLIAILIPFPFYIFTMLAFATNNTYLKLLKYLSPYTFTEPVGWFKDGHAFDSINFYIFLGLTLCVLIYSFLRFRKREIV